MQGHVSITLRNPNGRIAAKTGGQNMITDAIRRLLNPPMMPLRNVAPQLRGYLEQFMPIGQKAFGGIMLWGGQLPETADTLIPPDPFDQVGHAGSPYAGESVRRGSYNTIESGAVEGGYKHVWDFNSNQANGTIRALTATFTPGGNLGWFTDIVNDEGALLNIVGPGNTLDGDISRVPMYSVFSPTQYLNVSGIASTTQVCIGYRRESGKLVFYYGYRSGSNIIIKKVTLRDDEVATLMQSSANASGDNASDVSEFVDYQFVLERTPSFPQWWHTTDTEIIIPTWISATQYHLCRIDLDTMQIAAQATISVPQGGTFGSSIGNTSHFVAEGYLYISNANASGWRSGAWRVNLANLADVQEVDIMMYNVSAGASSYTTMSFGLPNGAHIINNGAGTYSLNTGRLVYGGESSPCRFRRSWGSLSAGVMRAYTDRDTLPYVYVAAATSSTLVGVHPLLYYLVPIFTSIYNLPTPVTKSPGQTMKIEYTFLEGEEGGGGA